MINISASILAKSEKEKSRIYSEMQENFGIQELYDVHDIDDLIIFTIGNVLCIPLLINDFDTLQILVNGNPVNMSNFK